MGFTGRECLDALLPVARMLQGFSNCAHVERSLAALSLSGSGSTRVSATEVMKLVSPAQRGRT